MKAVVAAFNQEKSLVGAFSVIVQPVVEPMDRFTAQYFTYCSCNIVTATNKISLQYILIKASKYLLYFPGLKENVFISGEQQRKYDIYDQK